MHIHKWSFFHSFQLNYFCFFNFLSFFFCAALDVCVFVCIISLWFILENSFLWNFNCHSVFFSFYLWMMSCLMFLCETVYLCLITTHLRFLFLFCPLFIFFWIILTYFCESHIFRAMKLKSFWYQFLFEGVLTSVNNVLWFLKNDNNHSCGKF